MNQVSDKNIKDEILELLVKAKFEKENGNLINAIKELQNANKKIKDIAKLHPKKMKTKKNIASEFKLEILYLNTYGDILYDIEEYQEALDKYIEIDTQNLRPDIQKAQGDCLRNLSNYEEAHKKYQKALELYKSEISSSYEDDAAVYNSIGLTYVAQGNNKNALEEFERAITSSIENPNPLYYCNKGSLLHSIGAEYATVTECYIKAYNLYNEGKVEGLTSQNINYIVEIIKPFISLLCEKKFEVTKDNEFANKHEEENKMDIETSRSLKSFMLSQHKLNSAVEADIEYLKKYIAILEKNVAKISEVSKDMFEKLESMSTEIYNINEELRVLKIESDGIKKWKVYISDTLNKANVFLEVEIKEEFESLKEVPEVYTYATTFYKALRDSFVAYSLINIGLIKGRRLDNTGVIGKVSKGLGIASKIFMLLGVADVSQSISIVVGILNIINGFYKEYSKITLDRLSKQIANNLTSSLLEKDFNLAIAKSAIAIGKSKEETLKKVKLQNPEQINKIGKWFRDTFETLATKITKINSVPECMVSKMALKDVALFITYSFVKSTQQDQETKLSTENVERLSKNIEELFEAKMQLLTELYENTKKRLNE